MIQHIDRRDIIHTADSSRHRHRYHERRSQSIQCVVLPTAFAATKVAIAIENFIVVEW